MTLIAKSSAQLAHAFLHHTSGHILMSLLLSFRVKHVTQCSIFTRKLHVDLVCSENTKMISCVSLLFLIVLLIKKKHIYIYMSSRWECPSLHVNFLILFFFPHMHVLGCDRVLPDVCNVTEVG